MYLNMSKINCPVSDSTSLSQQQLTKPYWIGFPSCLMKIASLLAIAWPGTPIENLILPSSTLLYLI